MAVHRALISVWDKDGLLELAHGLQTLGIEIVASGGTARVLREAGLAVLDVADVTGFPEILGGRVKTLHPAIHGGILGRRSGEHLDELRKLGIVPIDLVVCNLYPFAQTVAQPGVTLADAVEHIDIGGVTLLRAAAKNFESVIALCDPADYPMALDALTGDGPDESQRRRLALKAFQHTAAYDAAIAAFLADSSAGPQAPPGMVQLTYERVQTLRYGENPHQLAALYRPAGRAAAFEQLHGKEMSYNNWLDLDAAWALLQEFEEPTAGIIKHTNPCGVASAAGLVEAYALALESDPVSAFGSIIAVNRPVDLGLAEAMADLFVEVLVSPGYTDSALEKIKRKPNLRVMQPLSTVKDDLSLRSVAGGLLAQAADRQMEDVRNWRTVTRRQPTVEELSGLAFAWRVAKHVKSNAIVLAQGTATVGVGAGQMSRVDSVHLAARRAGQRARSAVMASDAFFPFPDGIEVAAAAGVTAVVQPGGSLRDDEVIAVCDRLGLAMCLTGVRHFRH